MNARRRVVFPRSSRLTATDREIVLINRQLRQAVADLSARFHSHWKSRPDEPIMWTINLDLMQDGVSLEDDVMTIWGLVIHRTKPYWLSRRLLTPEQEIVVRELGDSTLLDMIERIRGLESRISERLDGGA